MGFLDRWFNKKTDMVLQGDPRTTLRQAEIAMGEETRARGLKRQADNAAAVADKRRIVAEAREAELSQTEMVEEARKNSESAVVSGTLPPGALERFLAENKGARPQDIAAWIKRMSGR